jgi:hypothetical protein
MNLHRAVTDAVTVTEPAEIGVGAAAADIRTT